MGLYLCKGKPTIAVIQTHLVKSPPVHVVCKKPAERYSGIYLEILHRTALNVLDGDVADEPGSALLPEIAILTDSVAIH